MRDYRSTGLGVVKATLRLLVSVIGWSVLLLRHSSTPDILLSGKLVLLYLVTTQTCINAVLLFFRLTNYVLVAWMYVVLVLAIAAH
jgi:hypothetical protein